MEFASITITAWFNGRFMDDGTDGDDEDGDVVVDEHGVELEEEESTLDHTISLERSSHQRRRRRWVRVRDEMVRGIRPLGRVAEDTSELPLPEETHSHCCFGASSLLG